MKNVLFFVLILVSTLGFSQTLELKHVSDGIDGTIQEPIIHCVSQQTFPNYNFTDQYGGNINLYDYLNSGKTVILNFVSNWNNESMERIHVLNHLYSTYEEINQKAKIITLEMSSHSALNSAGVSVAQIPGQWGINHSFVNIDGLDNFLTGYVTSAPTYIVIAPNKSFETLSLMSSNKRTLSKLNQAFLTSQGQAKDYDLDILDFRFYTCADDYIFKGYIQNTGENPIASYYLILEDLQNNPLDSQLINIPLSMDGIIEFIYTIPQSSLAQVPVNLRLKANVPNENTWNNLRSSYSTSFTFSSTIKLELQPDNYPQETGWFLYNKTTDQIEYSQGYNFADSTIIGVSGSYQEQYFNLNDENCYRFIIFDKYNDGICCANGVGFFKLYDTVSNQVIIQGGNFLSFRVIDFEVNNGQVSVSEIEEDVLDIPIKTVYYNTLGQQIIEPIRNQLTIKKTFYANGKQKNEKIYLK
jgi:hypothetical protein